MTDPVPRLLPVDVVVRRSFQFAWESRAVLALPLGLLTLLTVTIQLIVNQIGGAHGKVYLFAGAALQQVISMSFAVGIHRYVLLAEIQAGPGFFRRDKHFLHYLSTMIVLIMGGMLAFTPMVGVGGQAAGPPGSGAAGMLAVVALIAAATGILVLARLALGLPAAAIGEARPMRDIWRATDGNALRLLAIWIVIEVPFGAALVATVGLVQPGATGGLAVAIVQLVLLALLGSVQQVVVTIMHALCYDVLVRGGGPRRSPS
jgi:hypothetical protein